MAKPIVVVYVPEDNYDSHTHSKQAKDVELSRPDYYWFIVPTREKADVTFQVFYEKDFTDIQYEELKKLIEDNVKEQTK